MSFAPKELAEEREIRAAKWREEAKRNWSRAGFGCFFLAILAALFLAYIAGAVSSAFPDCDKPTHVSTP